MSDREASPIPISPNSGDRNATFWQSGGLLTTTPTTETPTDFRLNTVEEDLSSADVIVNSSSCACGPDCEKECCRRGQHRGGVRGSLVKPSSFPNETRRLLSPVQNTSPSPPSPSSSYGSTDDTDSLIPNHRSDVLVSAVTR